MVMKPGDYSRTMRSHGYQDKEIPAIHHDGACLSLRSGDQPPFYTCS